MLFERMMYRMRKNNSWADGGLAPDISDSGIDFAKHALTAKMIIFAILVIV